MEYMNKKYKYAHVVWGGSCDSNLLNLEHTHVNSMRLVTSIAAKSKIANCVRMFVRWQSMKQFCNRAMLIMLHMI